MLDLEQLAEQREKAYIDKADLFDFYHDNWDDVIAQLRAFQEQARDAKGEDLYGRGT